MSIYVMYEMYMEVFKMSIIDYLSNPIRFDLHDQHREVKCMKITLIVTAMLSVLLLQACGSLTDRKDADNLDNQPQQLSDNALSGYNKSNPATSNNFRIVPAEDDALTTPEAQIIRELFQAGCLIENFELDRRKQNIRISCTNEFIPLKSSI